MKRTLWATIMCAVLLALLSLPAFAWMSARDSKSIAELQLMTERELASEGADVCIVGAFDKQHGGFNKDAALYVQTIGRVARAQHGGVPLHWANDYMSAVLAGNPNACISSHMAMLREAEATPTVAVPTAQPTVATKKRKRGK